MGGMKITHGQEVHGLEELCLGGVWGGGGGGSLRSVRSRVREVGVGMIGGAATGGGGLE